MHLIEICVCTYRRYGELRRLLRALGRQTLPPEAYRIVIVDNTPEGDRLALDAADLPGNAQVVYSAPPGLSRARNLGLSRCEARLLAFLDDDTEPLPDWLESLVRGFRDHPDAGVLGGPILPVWPTARPAWLPKEKEAALAILDYGSADRPLEEGEYLFGANLAVQVSAARAGGGFDDALGRRGGLLVSNEETALQDRVRAAGFRICYVAGAAVRHHVHEERLTQAWFRRRFAWQGVSDAIAFESRGGAPPWVAPRLRALAGAEPPGVALLDLFEDVADPGAFDARLQMIHGVTAQLLGAGELGGRGRFTARGGGAGDPGRRAASPPGERAGHEAVPPWLAPRIPLGTSNIFVDFQGSHSFLYELYGALPRSAYVEYPLDPWRRHDRAALAYFERFVGELCAAAATARARLVFLTLDPFLSGEYATRLLAGLERRDVAAVAFLHRVDWAGRHLRSLRALSRRLKAVVSLLEDAAAVEPGLELPNLRHLPLHSVHQAWDGWRAADLRRRLGLAPGDRVAGLLGEARPGKGLARVLEALRSTRWERYQDVVLLFAGCGSAAQGDAIRRAAGACGARVICDVRERDARRGYRVLTDDEMDGYVAITDWGIFPYHGPQRSAMSGLLPALVRARKPALAAEESYVGRLVRRHGLGAVFRLGDAGWLETAIGAARELQWGGETAERFREACGDEAVLRALSEILDG